MASEQEIIRTIEEASKASIKIRVLDQLGHKIKPQHRELIRFLVKLAGQEKDQEVVFSVKSALFKLRSRYNITNFSLFLMDPTRLLQSSDPAYRLKALEVFEGPDLTLENCTAFLGSLHFEDDGYVLSRMLQILPKLSSHLPLKKIETLLSSFLNHDDSRVRLDAIEALGGVRLELESQNLQMLWNCLKDPNQRVRSNALSQLRSEETEAVKEMLFKSLEVSQDYYELLSCLHLFEVLEIEPPREEVKRVQSLMQKLEQELQSTTDSGTSLDLGSGTRDAKMLSVGNVLSLKPWVFISLAFLTVLIFSFRVAKSQKQWKLRAETLEKQGQILGVELAKAKKEVQDLSQDVLIAKRELPWKAKLHRFQALGQRLRQNADVFMQQAREQFEQEEYKKTIELYKSIYQVYKDNRLAVDAVRWLSRTQKIQNILASVEDYHSKGQSLSAERKLGELRHLVSKDVYLIHQEKIKKLKN
jgi:hypothetical protein